MKSQVFESLVLNASPCICLAKADLLHIPQLLARRVVVPDVVATEILASETEDAATAAIRRPYGERLAPSRADQRVLVWALGAGETAVLSLCIEHAPQFIAVLDDGLARRCARALGVRCMGTVGLMVAARRQRLIESLGQSIRHLLDAGLYLDNATIRDALRLAGEDEASLP